MVCSRESGEFTERDVKASFKASSPRATMAILAPF